MENKHITLEQDREARFRIREIETIQDQRELSPEEKEEHDRLMTLVLSEETRYNEYEKNAIL